MVIIQLFEIFGSVLLKDGGVESQLSKIENKAKGTGNIFNDVFGKIGGLALKLGAVLGAGMGIKEMVDSAAAAQKNLAQMNSVLASTHSAAGMTQKALLDLADAHSKISLNSKGAEMQTESLMLTFTKIGKDVFPQALGVIDDMSQALGTDTKSSATMLGKALQDPIKGITALSRVGVNFTAQQKEQIKGFVATGQSVKAQQIILKELGTEYGGSALSASKTFSGQMTVLKNGFISMGGSIGNTVLPYLTQFTTSINTNMPKIKQVITSVATTVAEKFKTWATIIGQIAKEAFPGLSKGVDGVKGKVSGFSGTLDIVTKSLGFVRDNIGFVKAALEILGGIWLINKGYLLVTNGLLIIHNTITAVTATASWLATAGTTAFGIALKIATGPVGLIIAALIVLGGAIYEIVTHWDVIKAKTLEVWNNMKTAVVNKVGEIKDGIVKGFNEAIAWIKALPGQAIQWGKDLIDSIGKGIIQAKDDVVNNIGSIATAIKTKFESMFGIHSPSTVGFAWGGHIIQGLMNGMSNKDLGGFVTSMISKVKSTVGGIASSAQLTGWIMAALGITGTSLSWLAPLGQLIGFESGGNPNAVNNTDSNAKKGTPSQGLMQEIPSTYNAYKLAGFDGGITDPLSNIIAGIRYIKARYGDISQTPGMLSVANGGAYKGYAAGTNDFMGGMARVNEAGGEIMNLPDHTQIIPHDVSMEMAKNKKDNEAKSIVNHFSIDHINLSGIQNGSQFMSSLITYSKTHQ